MEVYWNVRYQAGMNNVTRINDKSNGEFKKRTERTGLVDIVESKDSSLQEKYSQWSEEVSKIAKEIYVTTKKKKKECPEIRKLRRKKKLIKESSRRDDAPKNSHLNKIRKILIESHIIHLQQERRRDAIKDTANSIKKESGFDGGAFWEFKIRQQGKKETKRR